ncbi:hypothetical protein ZHAS_00017484 [Anopheles sinensis]|uniref:Uncharacterized protein n=1 Tax=Anopheles sinensis TaxID=74873 RepID=A0A084WGP1_ANOSI|nr:hypothetical protein ZHAS_00017484 [Anopheles sinensis]
MSYRTLYAGVVARNQNPEGENHSPTRIPSEPGNLVLRNQGSSCASRVTVVRKTDGHLADRVAKWGGREGEWCAKLSEADSGTQTGVRRSKHDQASEWQRS